ncbi:hypothetical protein NKH18_45855 [Streptomyces sp. M10(2022)]
MPGGPARRVRECAIPRRPSARSSTPRGGQVRGYYRNEAANAERVRHGWYWTGDLGYVDEAGYFYFAGRSGDWIRVDGENTSALVTERILRRHPGIVAAGVFGVPDPRSGDQVMAAIEIPEGTRFEDLDLSGFLARQQDLGTRGHLGSSASPMPCRRPARTSCARRRCSWWAGAPMTPSTAGPAGASRSTPR